MRANTWPSGKYNLHQNPAENSIPTISGVLHIRDGLFGHKWVYKLNESRRNFDHKTRSNHFRIILVISGLILVVFALGLTLWGQKFFYTTTRIEPTKSSPELYGNLKGKLKIIFQVFKLNETLKFDHNKTVQNVSQCMACKSNEICLQSPNESYPNCVPIVDPLDPTGCGGLCALEIQSCKQFSAEHPKLFSCLNVETLKCAEHQWKCRESLMCIAAERRCDGLIDCYDKSDEYGCPCDLSANFRCGGNISCVAAGRKCDGSVDCWDASDELKCNEKCSSVEFPCYNGQCIVQEKFCDGRIDCLDQSDEPQGCIVLH